MQRGGTVRTMAPHLPLRGGGWGVIFTSCSSRSGAMHPIDPVVLESIDIKLSNRQVLYVYTDYFNAMDQECYQCYIRKRSATFMAEELVPKRNGLGISEYKVGEILLLFRNMNLNR